MMKEGFLKQKLNPNPMQMSLKIRRISNMQKIYGIRQHLDSTPSHPYNAELNNATQSIKVLQLQCQWKEHKSLLGFETFKFLLKILNFTRQFLLLRYQLLLFAFFVAELCNLSLSRITVNDYVRNLQYCYQHHYNTQPFYGHYAGESVLAGTPA